MYGDLYSERHDDCPDNNDTIKRERDYDILSSSRIPSAVFIIIVWLTCLFVFIGNVLLRFVCIEIFQVDINENIQIHASCSHNRRKEKRSLVLQKIFF